MDAERLTEAQRRVLRVLRGSLHAGRGASDHEIMGRTGSTYAATRRVVIRLEWLGHITPYWRDAVVEHESCFSWHVTESGLAALSGSGEP